MNNPKNTLFRIFKWRLDRPKTFKSNSFFFLESMTMKQWPSGYCEDIKLCNNKTCSFDNHSVILLIHTCHWISDSGKERVLYRLYIKNYWMQHVGCEARLWDQKQVNVMFHLILGRGALSNSLVRKILLLIRVVSIDEKNGLWMITMTPSQTRCSKFFPLHVSQLVVYFAWFRTLAPVFEN